MKWYKVTKKIAGKPYIYRQRTYREGGKVRTQSQYVGAGDEHHDWIPKDRRRNVKLPRKAFWPNECSLKVSRASKSIKKSGVSISAMKAEYARVANHLKKLELNPEFFPSISLLEGTKASWRRKGKSYEVILAPDKKSSGRNRIKKTYRLALANAFLDSIEIQSPTIYDCLRTVMDLSWFNTKMVVTEHIFRSNEPHKAWVTMQFLWSGSLPRSLEKQLGKRGHQKLQAYKPLGWRDEAAELISDVIQRGYKPSVRKLSKERSKAKAAAKRALGAYKKLSPIARFTKKGRKKWKLYKKYEAKFLLANQKKTRLEMFAPFLKDFHK